MLFSATIEAPYWCHDEYRVHVQLSSRGGLQREAHVAIRFLFCAAYRGVSLSGANVSFLEATNRTRGPGRRRRAFPMREAGASRHHRAGGWCGASLCATARAICHRVLSRAFRARRRAVARVPRLGCKRVGAHYGCLPASCCGQGPLVLRPASYGHLYLLHRGCASAICGA